VLPEALTVQKLRTLAKSLGVSQDEIFMIARGTSRPGEMLYTIKFSGINDVPEDRRERLVQQIKALIELELRASKPGRKKKET
jgi:hypothetical protein